MCYNGAKEVMAMRIRTMLPEDFPAVSAMMDDLHALHVAGRPDLYVPMSPIYPENVYLEKLDSPDMLCLLAEEDGAPAGLCFVEMRKRTCMRNIPSAYVDDMYVAPAFRRRGVATALFREAEALAKAKGAVRLDLMVWNFNENALAFYQSLGMKPQRYILELPLTKEEDA